MLRIKPTRPLAIKRKETAEENYQRKQLQHAGGRPPRSGSHGRYDTKPSHPQTLCTGSYQTLLSQRTAEAHSVRIGTIGWIGHVRIVPRKSFFRSIVTFSCLRTFKPIGWLRSIPSTKLYGLRLVQRKWTLHPSYNILPFCLVYANKSWQRSGNARRLALYFQI